jgi:molybdopterin/thiamine biosynthesis adenylyltransferase/rhodanese-related sulfurtransferase
MAPLSPAELSRYSRQLLLPEIGPAGQRRLKESKVLVVGAGGLGSPTALYLAAAGVGTLGIADFDRVATHNLQRQLLHTDARVGEFKVTSALARLREVNPAVNLRAHEEGVTPANAIGLFTQYDVIVDATDSFPARYLNNDAAVRTRRPLVHGSVFQFEGSVAVFAPHLGSPCYRCLFPRPPAAGAVPGCGEAGVLGATCGVIGSLQALEALKLIVGFGEPLLGRYLTFDASTARTRCIRLARDPACPECSGARTGALESPDYAAACGLGSARATTPSAFPMTLHADPSPPLEVAVHDAARLLREHGSSVCLIDVREPHEAEICRIAEARLIPMQLIPAHVDSLPTDQLLLIHCHHGGRSLRVTEYLRARGIARVCNVAGGIQAWAECIDPTLARY